MVKILATYLLFALSIPQGFRLTENISDLAGALQELQVWKIACGVSTVPEEHPVTWFATHEGLFSYDGTRVARHPSGKVSALRDLQFDAASGRLYSAGDSGIGWWAENRFGRMEYHPVAEIPGSALTKTFWRVRIAPDGRVLFQNRDEILVWDPATEQGTSIPAEEEFRYMCAAGDVIYVQDGPLLYNIHADGTLQQLCHLDDRVMDMALCGGRTVIALENTGLFGLDADGRVTPLDPGSNMRLARAKILSLAAYRDGLLVGTTREGVFITDSDGRIDDGFRPANNIRSSTVLTVGSDSRGDIWAGMEAGVARIDSSTSDYYFEESRLGRVRAVVSLPDGRLAAGSNKGLFVTEGDSFRIVPGTTGSVWNLATLDGQVFVAHDRGLFLLDGKLGLKPLYTGTGVLSIVQHPTDRDKYICGTYQGLSYFEKTPGGARFAGHIDGYSGYCRYMRSSPDGCLWIRDSGFGFIRLRLAVDEAMVAGRQDFHLMQGGEEPLFIAEKSDTLLFCCGDRAYVADGNGELRQDPEATRLLAACGRGTSWLLQRDSCWWYGGRYGCGAVQKAPDGGWRNAGSILSGVSGKHSLTEAFPIEGGCAVGYLNGIATCYGICPRRGRLFVSRIEAHGAQDRGVLALDGGNTRIPYNLNTVLVYLSAEGGGSFADYRLSPDSPEWKTVPLQGPVQLASLPYGRHEIQFRLSTAPDVCCSAAIRIRRPWYISGWAIAAYLLALFSLAAGIRAYYMRQARKAQEHARLKADLKTKSKDLANITFNSARRGRQLNAIRAMLVSGEAATRPSEVARISRETVRMIDSYLADEGEWEKSEEYFNVIYDGLLERLRARYPEMSKTDMKLCVYTKMNLSTKEIADLMNISPRSVEMARWRLRKRLGLPPGGEIAGIWSY